MKSLRHVAAVVLALMMTPVILFAGGMKEEEQVQAAAAGGAGGGSVTNVPQEYQQYVLTAGAVCDEVTPSLIAAQIEQESGWDPKARSPVGAEGIAQFMPNTWAAAGKDGDGDGAAIVTNPADAIISQGHYMCAQVAEVKKLIEGGSASGDVVDLALAAYNAGLGNVRSQGGVPPFKETQNYVASIKKKTAKYEVTQAPAGGPVVAAEGSAATVIEAPAFDQGAYPPETMSLPDPTPGAHGVALVTPRMDRLIRDVMATFPQIVNSALYCWDAHTFSPHSWHPKGMACDIPYYGCSADPGRSANPSTGLAAGNAAVNWLLANAQTYGIKYVIWQGRVWRSSTGVWAPWPDSGCSGGHYDHIHVNVL